MRRLDHRLIVHMVAAFAKELGGPVGEAAACEFHHQERLHAVVVRGIEEVSDRRGAAGPRGLLAPKTAQMICEVSNSAGVTSGSGRLNVQYCVLRVPRYPLPFRFITACTESRCAANFRLRCPSTPATASPRSSCGEGQQESLPTRSPVRSSPREAIGIDTLTCVMGPATPVGAASASFSCRRTEIGYSARARRMRRSVVPVLSARPGALFVKAGFEPLHGAAIEHEGQAIAFLGESGFGKSTLAGSFIAAGGRLLTDDLLLLRPSDGKLIAYPGPTKNQTSP